MENQKISKNGKNENQKTVFSGMLKGLGAAYALTVLVFIVYAVILTYTDISEKNIDTVVMVTTVVSVLLAGFDSARCAEKRGWLYGILSGIIYVSIMFIIGFCVVPDYTLTYENLMMLVLGICGGGLGGIIGINMKR